MQDQTWVEEHSEFIEVFLTRPVRDNGVVLNKLRIRQPIVNDLEKIDAEVMTNPMAMLRVMVASCSGVSDTAIRSLTVRDMNSCAEALGKLGFSLADAYSLLGQQVLSAPETGKTGSA